MSQDRDQERLFVQVTAPPCPCPTQIAFFLEKENKPPYKELTRGDLFKTRDVPVTPASSPVPNAPSSADPNSGYREPDARDLEMSRKVRRSYSRLEVHTSASTSTSTPGRRSCFGFEGLLAADDLAGVSPVVTSKITEAPVLPERPSVPDTTLPGISPPVTKEKRKKKKKGPELLVSGGWGRSIRAAGRARRATPAHTLPAPHRPFLSPRNQSWMSGPRP